MRFHVSRQLSAVYVYAARLKKRVLESIYYYFATRKGNNRKTGLTNADKVIFTAHPDDEILFFGSQLLSEPGWLVVCFTNGGNRKRLKEFTGVMKYIGAEYIIWNFEDGENIAWNKRRMSLMISGVLGLKNEWARVLTHNSEGEYGHFQHKQVHQAVSGAYLGSNLYFTACKGSFFKGENRLPEDMQKRKRDIFKEYYKSQCFILDYLPGYFENELLERRG